MSAILACALYQEMLIALGAFIMDKLAERLPKVPIGLYREGPPWVEAGFLNDRFGLGEEGSAVGPDVNGPRCK